MTAINHALTGAIIGFSVSSPLLAIILAFFSHYILDAIPHFGVQGEQKQWLSGHRFKLLLLVDALMCISLVGILAIHQPHNWVLAAGCAFIAASPDLFSINYFYRTNKNLPWTPSMYFKFASGIQWFEKPIGAIVEAFWFVSAIIVLRVFV